MKNSKSGQTLVTLLFFMVIALTITSASVIILFVNSVATSTFQDGIFAYHIAESGAENAILRLLRDPNYSGETLTIGDGSATIQVTGANTKVITSKARLRNFIRTIEVQASYNNNILTITSWKETY